jgi:PKD repeat protein
MKSIKLVFLMLLMVSIGSFAKAQCQAGFSYPATSFSVGDTISFTNTSSHPSAVSFYWQFGDGTVSYNKSPLKIYNKAGVYSVCLTIADSARNCTDTYCDSILVSSSTSTTCNAAFNFSVGSGANDKIVSFSNNSTYSGSSATYSWTFGDGNSSTSTAPMHTFSAYGNYQVTLEIKSGSCTDKVTKWVRLTNTSSSCSADFVYSFDSTNSCTIHFTNKSSAGLSSYWSFGDGSVSTSWSPSHAYAKDGYYSISLTVTDSSSSCSDSYIDSIYVRGCNSSSSCKISSIRSYQDSIDTCKTILVASVNSTGNGNIVWNFGDGNYGSGNPSANKYSAKGWYAVTASYYDSSSNCSATYTDSVWGFGCGSSSCNYVVAGQVLTGSSMAQYASVYLIQKNGNLLSLIDSVGVDSMGYYAFSNVCAGDYYVKAALLSGDMNYRDYLPTYYGGFLRWDSASTVSIKRSNFGLNINMIKSTNLGGPGFIGGDVRKGANKRTGEPLGQIQVVILNENLEAAAYTYSDENGEFELPDLAYGKYYLFVDIPGLKSLGTWIELSESNPKADDVIIEVNLDQVSTSISTYGANQTIEFSIYPNPSSGVLMVSLPSDAASIKVHDMSGKTISETLFTCVDEKTIEVFNFEKGVYLITVQNEKGALATKRVVVY